MKRNNEKRRWKRKFSFLWIVTFPESWADERSGKMELRNIFARSFVIFIELRWVWRREKSMETKRREKRVQNIKIFETNFQRDGTRKDYCIIYVSRGEWKMFKENLVSFIGATKINGEWNEKEICVFVGKFKNVVLFRNIKNSHRELFGRLNNWKIWLC